MSRNRIEHYLPLVSVQCRAQPVRPPYRGFGLNSLSRMCIGAQLVEQRFGLFQIAAVEPLM
jgi:hypothetical protein